MNVRELAFESIKKIIAGGAYSNLVVASAIKKQHLPEQERRFFTELVYGVTRQQNYLDWLIGKVSRPGMKIQLQCRIILYLGLYQIFCLNGIPESAACNESVKLAKKYGNPGMAKFVNAVLRSSIRRRQELQIPSEEEDIALHLALVYHQPLWLIKKWIREYGVKDAKCMGQYFDEKPPLCVRVNTLKTDVHSVKESLTKKGILAEEGKHAPEALYLKNVPNLQEVSEIQEGFIQVQEEVSMLAVQALDPQPGEIIMDMCAAPGGKTTHIAARMQNQGKVYAFDIHEHKLALIRENAMRLGISIIDAAQGDASSMMETFKEKADRVLIDAPCSGLGILRRKPDLRWRRTEKDLKNFPPVQLAILEAGASYVKPGGVLVYSTCTMNAAENEEVVRTFLNAHPEYALADMSGLLPDLVQKEKMLQLLPQVHQMDGFFIARLQKIN